MVGYILHTGLFDMTLRNILHIVTVYYNIVAY